MAVLIVLSLSYSMFRNSASDLPDWEGAKAIAEGLPKGHLDCAWFLKGGGKAFTSPGKTLKELPGHKGLGVVAEKAIKEGEVMVRVPMPCCISLSSADGTELEYALASLTAVIEQALNSSEASKSFGAFTVDSIKLTIITMREKQLGSDSRYYPYLATWPAEVHSAPVWTASERAWVKGTRLGWHAERARRVLERVHGAIYIIVNGVL
eukprot:CAMPEP_0172031752 /NCGR_PEP_ID=MMETSP1041-20130122/19483_1 /TAXON_ID=464988 /ORGANISM="Hemiselmis andersenii, Strain CCMP439" /LENGTH=207 /DNA_ID=CAMNT_0012688305 /DNA_START=26 /DNA_END=646 /DNA_ORIENTATION=-